MANNKKTTKPNYNLHEYMNKHRKKILTAISLTVVASMFLSVIAQVLVLF